jgi:hypothetical protein
VTFVGRLACVAAMLVGVSACGIGKVFAMQLSTGTETEVSFAAGENPVMPTKDVNWISFTPGEFWPQS